MKKEIPFALFILLAIPLLFGCAAAPKVWKSNPDIQRADNKHFYAQIASVGTELGYDAFYLYIKNRTDETLEIDWNKTLYISSGQTSGGFMFEGIDLQERHNSKPPDGVPPRGYLAKTIWPVDLASDLEHTKMGEGENGVYLSVMVDGKEINERIVVDLYKGKK